MAKEGRPEKVVQDIRRKTRREFSAEEKIRIVLEGLRGEESIVTLCRKEGLAPNLSVVARILTGPHDANRQDSHLPMRYDTGRPRAIIRLRISQPRTASLPCLAGLRARRPSPMMDL